jgi:hypothetical protein
LEELQNQLRADILGMSARFHLGLHGGHASRAAAHTQLSHRLQLDSVVRQNSRAELTGVLHSFLHGRNAWIIQAFAGERHPEVLVRL